MSRGFPVPATAEELLAQARRVTGIEMLDEDAAISLPVLIKAFNDSGQLHVQGAKAVHDNLLRRLCNRLRMQRDFARHPEIAEQEIKTPLVIISMPRTGSTKCHKVLAASGAFNWLPFWQCLNHALITGDRCESPDTRISDTDAHCSWFAEASPKAKNIHQLNTRQPEEDVFLLLSSLRFYAFFAYAPVDAYMRWLMAENPAAPFEYLRDSLKYLQWQGFGDPGKPWLLKAPTYLGMEPVINQVFPDAKFVVTHRKLDNVVPSSLSLFDAYRKPYTNTQYSLESMAADMGLQMDMHMRHRAAHPELSILDVDYEVSKSSPHHVVESIYRHAGISYKQENDSAVSDWEAAHPPPARGFHAYSQEEYELNADEINKAFASYLDRFLKYAAE